MRILHFLFILSLTLAAQVVHRFSFNRFAHYGPDDWVTFANADYVTSIDMGQDEIYFATRDGGIWRYHLYDQKWQTPFTTSTGLRSNNIRRIVYDPDSNQLFAFSEAGTDVYNSGFGYWTPAAPGEAPAPHTPRNTGNSDPYARPDLAVLNSLFVKGGYTLFQDGRLLDNNNYAYRITDRLVDYQRTLWLGTDGAGIGRVHLVTDELRFERRGPSFNTIRDIYRDARGALWLAGTTDDTRKASVVRYHPGRDSWRYYYSGVTLSITSSHIYAVDGNSRSIFFGGDRGLFAYDKRQKSWRHFSKAPLNDDAVKDLQAVTQGVFVATTNGLFFRKNGAPHARIIGRKQLFQRPVNKLYHDGGFLYIATDQGLYRYNIQTDSLRYIPEASTVSTNFSTALTVRSDTLWFASRFGVGLYALNTDSWRSFSFQDLNFFPHVYDMTLLDDNLWLATDQGLLKYDTYRDYWYLYTTEDGLPDNRVYHVQADEAYLWLGTGHGLVHFKWYDENRDE
ncbi:MAG: hypothetical protein D6677_01340 [Calditrichaeota bacterium]|nr:MAG: hypothetical protein D6677_01340 [Calditrichota bacterium]